MTFGAIDAALRRAAPSARSNRRRICVAPARVLQQHRNGYADDNHQPDARWQRERSGTTTAAGCSTTSSALRRAARPPHPSRALRTISIVPSVTMNGTTLRRVMRRPFTRPQAAAAATPLKPATAGDAPFRSRTAITTVVSEMTEPTDRSMPPATMTRRHADRRHADDRRLARHQLQIAGLDELDPGEQREHERDEHQPDEGARAIQQGSCRHARAAPPVIVATIKSDSVRLETGCAACSRPRNMTAMRSQTPSSSGR